MSDRLEFFFDPICPFCWVTSRWVVEVARQRPLEVTWRPVSLAILNEEISYEERRKASPDYPDSHVRGLEMLRVVHAAREAHGPEVVGDLYTALGGLVWDQDPPEGDDFHAVMHEMARRRDLRPALEQVGLPTDLADAADDTTRDDDLRAETEEAAQRCGGGVGTPILSFSPPDQDGDEPGPALFGPVIDAPPEGDDALRLWDAVQTLAEWGGFAELKRTLRSFPDTPLSQKLARTGTTVR
ncbi:mycothiol-dependent nitroreductase Rv2466c family protein [Actinomycetospora lemnae]|uniref:DsbA family protein n=1 Tax=Actinomycetospora lemnae TaxID=3019891 RepID=A0ABT5SMX6_9PSEU|nr:DsbA family protein [Actinomycetospora sp. DW7H6]MDD7964026.1 DsbA family protein [Actinomycetospora sp. DW7H6]